VQPSRRAAMPKKDDARLRNDMVEIKKFLEDLLVRLT
jgi:hypothetical protein